MSDKSHVTVEQRVCPVCGHRHDTGTVLLDRRLRPVFEHHTTTGWGFCSDCEAKRQAGYIALVAVRDVPGAATVKPEDVYRTGRIVHVRAAVWPRIFNAPAPPRGFGFCPDEVIDRLESMMPSESAPAPEVKS
jgi:hypothetical protein